MWGVETWMCRFCAAKAWNDIGRSPAAEMRAKSRYHYYEDWITDIDSIPESDLEEYKYIRKASMPRVMMVAEGCDPDACENIIYD